MRLSAGALIVLILNDCSLAQSTVFWDAADGQWHMATNWNPQTVPVAAALQSATVDNLGIVRITQAVPDILSLDVDQGEVQVEAGGSIEITGATFVRPDGTIGVTGMSAQLQTQSMNIDGHLTVVMGGQATVSGQLELQAGAVIGINTGSTLSVDTFKQFAGSTMLFGIGSIVSTTTEVMGGSFVGGGSVTGNVIVGPLGTLRAPNGGTLSLLGQLTNFDSGTNTLSGGNYIAIGTLRFAEANIVTNSANISLFGPGSAIRDLSGNNALVDFAFNSVGASFNLGDVIGGKRDLSVSSSFSNAGKLAVRNGSRFTVNGTYTQTGGITELGTNAIGNVGELEATTVNLQAGLLLGTGTLLGNVTNAARISPGFSPGIITIDGDYTQTTDGVLVMELGGTGMPGTTYDQLAVMGSATLSGQLDLRFIDAGVGVYMPSDGDTFTLVTANQSLLGKFESVRVGKSLEGLAIRLSKMNSSVVLEFDAPATVPVEYNSVFMGTGDWFTNAGSVWVGGAPPDSATPVLLNNAATGPNPVTVTVGSANAFAHTVEVSGVSSDRTLTLSIESDRYLSAIQGTTIKNHGILELNNGTLVTNQLTVELGGTLRGNGTVAGDLTNSGSLSPGFSTGEIHVDGNGTLTSSSTVALEVEGVDPGTYDTIDFSGDLTLGGELVIDLTSMPTFGPGERIELITANSIAPDTMFEDIQYTGSSDTLFILTITADSADVCGPTPGDLNLNCDPGDAGDFRLLALALTDYEQYKSYAREYCEMSGHCLAPASNSSFETVANVDGLNDVDFDDILKLAEDADISLSTALELMYGTPSVPEPMPIFLVLVAIPFMSIRCHGAAHGYTIH